MKSRVFLVVALFSVLVSIVICVRANRGLADDLPPNHLRRVVNTDQGNREYVIYVPASCDLSKPVPLVIMLHGFGGTGLNAAQETGWSAKADQESFIIVYPEASRPNPLKPQSFRKNPQSWNDGSGRFHAAEKKIDDVQFIAAMLDQISVEYKLDSERIFVTGFSNGASMAFRLGAELSQRIAVIAPVAGTCWIEKPEPQRAISLCYITGLADSLNPIEGGFPKLALGGKEQGGAAKPPVQSFIDSWVKSLGCSELPRMDETISEVRKVLYGEGRANSEVMFITVEGLGHHWPGGVSQAPNFLVGKPSDKLKATDVLWEFFKAHPASSK
ncbi:MAG: hypothetical protein RLY14_983 [Planctomycetota bacterium]|jgi:polyhydroxybutyrate depolymerase